MAIPTCPKCDNRSFMTTEFEPLKSAFKLIAVHCSKCGAVVGVVDYYNIGSQLKKLAEKLGVSI